MAYLMRHPVRAYLASRSCAPKAASTCPRAGVWASPSRRPLGGTGAAVPTGTGGPRQFPLLGRRAAEKLGLRVVVVGRPGTGLSDPHPYESVADWATDVGHVADALGAQRLGVVGLSGGGPYTVACDWCPLSRPGSRRWRCAWRRLGAGRFSLMPSRPALHQPGPPLRPGPAHPSPAREGGVRATSAGYPTVARRLPGLRADPRLPKAIGACFPIPRWKGCSSTTVLLAKGRFQAIVYWDQRGAGSSGPQDRRAATNRPSAAAPGPLDRHSSIRALSLPTIQQNHHTLERHQHDHRLDSNRPPQPGCQAE